MARHDNRNRITTVGGPDRPHRFRLADACGNISVRGCLAIRYALQLIEHAQLKLRASQAQGQVEFLAFTIKVLGELLPRVRELLLIINPVRIRIAAH